MSEFMSKRNIGRSLMDDLANDRFKDVASLESGIVAYQFLGRLSDEMAAKEKAKEAARLKAEREAEEIRNRKPGFFKKPEVPPAPPAPKYARPLPAGIVPRQPDRQRNIRGDVKPATVMDLLSRKPLEYTDDYKRLLSQERKDTCGGDIMELILFGAPSKTHEGIPSAVIDGYRTRVHKSGGGR